MLWRPVSVLTCFCPVLPCPIGKISTNISKSTQRTKYSDVIRQTSVYSTTPGTSRSKPCVLCCLIMCLSNLFPSFDKDRIDFLFLFFPHNYLLNLLGIMQIVYVTDFLMLI